MFFTGFRSGSWGGRFEFASLFVLISSLFQIAKKGEGWNGSRLRFVQF